MGALNGTVDAGIITVQLSPAQIKAYALSRGTLAKTDRIDAELIARFMAFRRQPQRRLLQTGVRARTAR
ncbi:hypothetical protein NBRC116599_40510 [Aquicoccus sp. SU-CL01552]